MAINAASTKFAPMMSGIDKPAETIKARQLTSRQSACAAARSRPEIRSKRTHLDRATSMAAEDADSEGLMRADQIKITPPRHRDRDMRIATRETTARYA